MYCKRAVEFLKAHKSSRDFHEDKNLLNIFDNQLVEILGINTVYHIEFPIVKQLLYKISSAKMWDRLRCGLDTVKAKKKDIYNTNNHIITFRDLLKIVRIQIDEELDTITLNKFSSGVDNTDDRYREKRS